MPPMTAWPSAGELVDPTSAPSSRSPAGAAGKRFGAVQGQAGAHAGRPGQLGAEVDAFLAVGHAVRQLPAGGNQPRHARPPCAIAISAFCPRAERRTGAARRSRSNSARVDAVPDRSRRTRGPDRPRRFGPGASSFPRSITGIRSTP